MNKRIKELLDEASRVSPQLDSGSMPEVFASLIVEKCLTIIKEVADQHRTDDQPSAADNAAYRIKKYFDLGVPDKETDQCTLCEKGVRHSVQIPIMNKQGCATGAYLNLSKDKLLEIQALFADSSNKPEQSRDETSVSTANNWPTLWGFVETNKDAPLFILVNTLGQQRTVVTRLQELYGNVPTVGTLEASFSYNERAAALRAFNLGHTRILVATTFMLSTGIQIRPDACVVSLRKTFNLDRIQQLRGLVSQTSKVLNGDQLLTGLRKTTEEQTS